MGLADDIPKRIVDQTAETLAELARATGYGLTTLWKLAKERVASGTWEKVYKKVGNQVVAAYRRKQRKH